MHTAPNLCENCPQTKGGSYACYSPIRAVSHTRAGGEWKDGAKDFHTKRNKQVHLLATNQSGGSCTNINGKTKYKKREKNNPSEGFTVQTHAYNTHTEKCVQSKRMKTRFHPERAPADAITQTY